MFQDGNRLILDLIGRPGNISRVVAAATKGKDLMSEQLLSDGPWHIPDADWQCIEPLLPAPRPKPKGGRPRMPDRQALEAILFVGHSGCQWKQLPRGLGAASTVHDRYQQWLADGVFTRLGRAGLLDPALLQGLKITDVGVTAENRGNLPAGNSTVGFGPRRADEERR
jgi:transposase